MNLLDNILQDIMMAVSDKCLVLFLLVSTKVRKMALNECKRRSRVPHLWDVPRDELIIKINTYKSYLRTIIHTDYCLCAYIGFVHERGLLRHLSSDLYYLAKRMKVGHITFAFAYRAASLGLDDVFMDLNGRINNEFYASAAKYSLSAKISTFGNAGRKVHCHKYHRLYQRITERNIAKLTAAKNYGVGKLYVHEEAARSIATYLVHRRDREMLLLLSELIDDFQIQVRAEIDYIGLQHDLPFPQPLSEYIWTKDHLDMMLATKIKGVICVDDPAFITTKSNRLERLAYESACYKILNALDSTYVTEISFDVYEIYKMYHVWPGSRSFLVALLNLQSDLELAKIAEVSEQWIIDHLPNGPTKLRKAYTVAAEYYAQKADKIGC